MTWDGGLGRIVFWRSLTTAPTIPVSEWTGPTGFSTGRDELPDEGKGSYGAGSLPITGMGMVDILFHPTFAAGTSGRRIARVLLNGDNIGQDEDTSSSICSVLVSTLAFVKPGDVLAFEVFQAGVAGGLALGTGPGSYISVLSR